MNWILKKLEGSRKRKGEHSRQGDQSEQRLGLRICMEYSRMRNGHICWNEDSIWELLGEISLEARGVMVRALISEPRNYSEGSKEPLNIFEQ